MTVVHNLFGPHLQHLATAEEALVFQMQQGLCAQHALFMLLCFVVHGAYQRHTLLLELASCQHQPRQYYKCRHLYGLYGLCWAVSHPERISDMLNCPCAELQRGRVQL